MNHKTRNVIGGVIAVIAATTLVINALVRDANGTRVTLTPADAACAWEQKDPPNVATITKDPEKWTMTAGGVPASTHYARIRYGLPECANAVWTRFYMRLVIMLPLDFYNVLSTGFRFGNTDNYLTTYLGSKVGASGGNEIRVSAEMWNDKTLRLRSEHQNGTIKDFWISPPQFLTPGMWHTIEIYGDVAQVSPWYIRVDGMLMASGVDMLATTDTAPAERLITRMVCGIDGAWNQDAAPLRVYVRECTFADYDINSIVPPATAAPITPSLTNAPATVTVTRIPATGTVVPSVTRTATPLPPVSQTPSAVPTVCLPQFKICIGPLP